jgi:ubiquinol-cytochrome c reductase cytochrome c subunit
MCTGVKLVTALALLLLLPSVAAAKDRRGAALYAANCASCHGLNGQGVAIATPGANGTDGQGPPLRNVGARAADFYLRTGYMPLGEPDEQPRRHRVLFSDHEIRAMVDYIASLGKGPRIPKPHPERGSLSEGFTLFQDHCAGCHQIVGEGGYVTGAVAPPLHSSSAVQIAQAVRIGPYVMPRFSERAIGPHQLDSLIAYVQYTKDPQDSGGWSIGRIGPVPEGLVAWGLGMLVLVGTCVVIGRGLSS